MHEDHWLEFPFVPLDAWGEPVADVLLHFHQHLPVLRDIAAALTDAGWPLRLTLTGLAFCPPDEGGLTDRDDSHDFYLDVRQRLQVLGVTAPFEEFAGNSLAEANQELQRLMAQAACEQAQGRLRAQSSNGESRGDWVPASAWTAPDDERRQDELAALRWEVLASPWRDYELDG